MTRAAAALLAAASLLAAAIAPPARAEQPGHLERAVCGWFAEPLGFLFLHWVAGSPRAGLDEQVAGLERVRFTTMDGRVLGGYRFRASPSGGGAPRGYVLVAQGNAMLAEHTIPLLGFFADAGFDAWAYDFRGYGLSQGKSRLAAILSDYVEIIADLNRRGYERRLLYGTSLGGVIFLNAMARGIAFDAAAIDSAPSEITGYGCPRSLDPVNGVPEDASRLVMIVGERDRVVPPRKSRRLADRIEARGGAVVRREDFAHPFQDRDRETALARWRLVLDFFARAEGDG